MNKNLNSSTDWDYKIGVPVLSARNSLDIERLCERQAELQEPIDVFVVSHWRLDNSILAISVRLLERGQQLAWPGMRLLGATLDPNWGFSRIAVTERVDGRAVFGLPQTEKYTLNVGDTYGYRFCELQKEEHVTTKQELFAILSALDHKRFV